MYFLIFSLIVRLAAETVERNGGNDYVNQYILDLEKKDAAVVVVKSKSATDSTFAAMLIIVMGTSDGLLVESHNNVIVNTATIRLSRNGAEVKETHGGVYTYRRVGKLLSELIHMRFELLAPISKASLERVALSERCSNLPTMTK